MEEPLGTDSHRAISKNSSECWLLIGHKKCFVLLCPIGEQFLLSSFREFVHDGYYLATVAWFVHQAFPTRNEGTTDESKNVSDAISRSNSICTEKILFLTDHNVSQIIGRLRCSGDEKVKKAITCQGGGLGLAWPTNRSRRVEQEAVIEIFHLYTPLMSSKRKGRSSTASQSSNQSPEEKRSKNSETDEVFEALEMEEDVGLKLQRVLYKLEKLDKIEAHLSEVSASLASIEEKVSGFDEDVQDLKQKKHDGSSPQGVTEARGQTIFGV